MKTRRQLQLWLLAAIALAGIGAAGYYTIADLTNNAAPGAGTIIEVYDPTATPNSGKLTLNSTAFRAAAGVTAAFVQANQTNVAAANPTGTASGTAVNGSAATFMRSDAAPALSATLQHYAGTDTNAILTAIGGAPLAGATFTGPISAPRGTFSSIQQQIRSDLTHAGTVTLDMSTNTSQYLVLTGAVTFAFSNIGTNTPYQLLIANGQATNCAVTMPAESVRIGFVPSAIAAGKYAWVWFTPHPIAATNKVFTTFAEQP